MAAKIAFGLAFNICKKKKNDVTTLAIKESGELVKFVRGHIAGFC